MEDEQRSQYKQLITKRASVKGQITKFKNYLISIQNNSDLSDIQLTELTLKIAKFEALSIKIDDLQSEIEVLCPENISTEIEERDKLERDVILLLATSKNLVERFSKKSVCEQRRNSIHNSSCCVSDPQPCEEIGLKLPQIQIAPFDGKYFRWLEFRDTFESLIHRNDRISDINKFHYLNSYLQGDASRVLANLEVSNVNYAEAWKLLCNRYNNKRILINHHLNALFNMKHLPQETERSLRMLVDNVTKNLRALAGLGQPTDKWDVLIIFMLSSKLDSNTLTKWEEYRNNLNEDTPSLKQFFKFIIDRANVLESLSRNSNSNNKSEPPRSDSNSSRSIRHSFDNNNYQRQGQNNNIKSFAGINNNNKSCNNNRKLNMFSCIICSDRHRIYDCPTFKSKGVDERMSDVVKYKLCVNCLRQGHSASNCRMGPCRERDCKQKHNSLLHRPQSALSSNHLVSIDEEEYEDDVVVNNYCNNTIQPTSHIILSTAIIEVSNPVSQQKINIRALLDCGSQSSFISESLKIKLSLPSHKIDSLKVIGIGNSALSDITESCNIKIKSLHSSFNAIFSCLVLKQLTGRLPRSPVDISQIKLPNNIRLADPSFHKPGRIDILIGADLFWDILGNEQRSLGINKPKLRSSHLGWLISGHMPIATNNKIINCNHAIIPDSNNINLDKILTKFWELEEIPQASLLSQGERECERHFIAHTTRDSTGRFCVKLPLKESADCLGDTYRLAKKRFMYLEKRFKKDPTLKAEYTKFIHEYAELGHLSVQVKNDIDFLNPYYYLCHHAVLKQESESTKLRVVFDGSAPSSSGYSLNNILMVGPNVQDSLFAILMRARQYKYLLSGDIEKMYRQILVHENDRNLQRILWRESENAPLQTLTLNTLTYGTANASFQSTRCLWQLGEEQHDNVIKTIIQQDFFVDDCITGSDDISKLIYIQKSLTIALKSGGFNLRKFKSNCRALFDQIEINKQDNLIFSESSSTLGLGWTPSRDTLHFPLKRFTRSKDEVITKRLIMSKSCSIFDPLGILSPVVVQPKTMLQKLWREKLDWDQPVPQNVKEWWIKFSNSLQYLATLEIPRLVLGDSPKSIELHSFSDASNTAYGACIYMKSIGHNGVVTIKLLCAKSKVAPLKTTTIPRLELCAALLAAKLTKSVLDSLRYRPSKIIHWCDSSVVLGWIKGDPSRLKIFVSNRITEITELTSASAWRYVPTDSNPADLISRGVDAKQLISMTQWWAGPNFLSKNEEEWPVLNVKNTETLPELKVHSAIICEPLIDFDRYSSLNKLQRSFAYVQRFIYCDIKNKDNRRVGTLTADELRDSLHSLCVIAQRQSFPVEYELLARGKLLNNKCKILSLSPFLDKDKLIRVGGRLDASCYTYEKKHPILLHSSHRLTKLFFEKEHLNKMHAGPQLLLAAVRETVWPVNGRHLARRTVSNCVRCRRLRGVTLQPLMGDLPPQRTDPGHPFASVGLDFAGPFYIVNRKGRGSRIVKCYLCLFVCMRYKCVHLEAVSDLTKDAFVMTLRRFIARRGKPMEIFSDNGTNFVAAAREIFSDNGTNFVAAARELGSFLEQNQDYILDFASQQSIQFKRIPSASPHFGGIFEAGVKSAKHHIKHVIGNSHLTFEEITTLFAQVEAILNSRPLCPLSSCPNDLLSLSPGHFIIGRPLTAAPAPKLVDLTESQLKRYERLEKLRQHFWQRWQNEYVSELQQRTKWKTSSETLNIGDMVLLADKTTHPLAWRLGRILRLLPGSKNTSRVADVLTNKGCKLHLITPPAFTVERIVTSNCGSRLCVWGTRGVIVVELPTRWGRAGLFESGNETILCKSATLDERFLYSQGEVRKVQWQPSSLSRLLVLVSDNTLRLYNIAVKTGPKLIKIIPIGPKPSGLFAGRTLLDSLGDTAVDFTPTPDSEHLLILRGNGDVYMMPCDIEGKSAMPKLSGPLAMYPPADDNYGTESCSIIALGGGDTPPLVVVATCSAALYHCLLLPNATDKEEGDSHALYVIEAVELNMVLTDDADLQYSYPVHLYPCTTNTYACVHAGGVHTVTLPVLGHLKDYALATEDETETVLSALCSKASSARHLLCTLGPRATARPPVGLVLTAAPLPNALVLCPGAELLVRCLEPYDLEEQLYKEMQLKNPTIEQDEVDNILKERQKLSFTAIIREILARDVSQPILNMNKTEEPTLKETLELVTQATMKLRGEYISRQQRAQDAISRKLKALASLSRQHHSWLQDLQTDVDDVNLQSNVLKEKCMLAEKHQDDMKYRCSAAIRKLRASGPASSGERELLRELEEHARRSSRLADQLQQLKEHSHRKAGELKKWEEEYKKKDIALGKSHNEAISSILQQQTAQISTLIEETKLLKDQLSIV